MSPSIFHQAVAKVLSRFSKPETIVQYVDDILIATEHRETHLTLLSELFTLLHDAGLKLNTKKVKLLKKEVRYLGVLISPGMRQPLKERITAVASLPIPKSHKDLRHFLGLVNFSREFIEGFAEKAKPLHDLLKKNYDNDDNFGPWKQEQQKAFEQLKQDLQVAPALVMSIPLQPFGLQVHTSETSVSAVLLQLQGKEWRILDIFLNFSHLLKKILRHVQVYIW